MENLLCFDQHLCNEFSLFQDEPYCPNRENNNLLEQAYHSHTKTVFSDADLQQESENMHENLDHKNWVSKDNTSTEFAIESVHNNDTFGQIVVDGSETDNQSSEETNIAKRSPKQEEICEVFKEQTVALKAHDNSRPHYQVSNAEDIKFATELAKKVLTDSEIDLKRFKKLNSYLFWRLKKFLLLRFDHVSVVRILKSESLRETFLKSELLNVACVMVHKDKSGKNTRTDACYKMVSKDLFTLLV